MTIDAGHIRAAVPGSGDGTGMQDGVWYVVVDGVAREATTAEILAATKLAVVAASRAECGRRIFERYPAWRQSNVALGVYAGPEAEARAAEMRDWLAAMVAAENTAADAIEAAQTVAAVEAVTVAWPA